jgi:hypothetical protein
MARNKAPSTLNTVFVVGAGASKEADLPIGSDLTALIAECLSFRRERGKQQSGNALIYEALGLAAKSGQYGNRPFTDYIAAAHRISRAMPQAISIDNFLDVHNEDALVELCGKLAIVRSILLAEAKSTMRVRLTDTGPTLSFKDSSSTYFSVLFQQITENCKFADLPNRLRQLGFVIFNYDRCIEHYLHYAICNYYSVDERDASEALQALQIFHPYGTVGSLPTQLNGPLVALGAEPTARQLLDLASRIKTFTEGTNPLQSDILSLRAMLATCTRVVFLGFAFHKLNLQLLAPDLTADRASTAKRIFGTAHGISVSDLELITNDIASRLGSAPQHVALRRDLKCADLFAEYRRSLSFV